MNYRLAQQQIFERVSETMKTEVVDFLIHCHDEQKLSDEWMKEALADKSWDTLRHVLCQVTCQNWEDEHYIAQIISYVNKIG